MGKSGYIYLIQLSDYWFRIGYTANLEQRFRSRRWEAKVHNYDLILCGLVLTENARAAEKALHLIFDYCRTNERWNGLGPRLEKFKLSVRDLKLFWMWAEVIGTEHKHTMINLKGKDWLSWLRTV